MQTRWLKLALVSGLLAALGGRAAPGVERSELEQGFRRAGKLLVAVHYTLGEQDAARSLVFTREVLRTHELYVRGPAGTSRFLYVGADGVVQVDGKRAGELRSAGEVLLSATGVSVFIDGQPLSADLGGGCLYWVSREPRRPPVQSVRYPRLQVYDGFMRTQLVDDHWQVASGRWELRQHGGGMPTDESLAADYNTQRAVNPFTVLGSGNGVLTYRSDEWPQCHAEARFYFGLPLTGHVADLTQLPTAADLLVMLGRPGEERVAFGWQGAAQAFVLLRATGREDWRVVQRWTGPRPPVSNWVRIGLELERAHVVRAWLDGVQLWEVDLGVRVAGQVSILSGREPSEFDDFRVWSPPAPPGLGAPVYVKSRQFAAKSNKPGADPVQFQQWAKASDAYLTSIEAQGDAGMATQLTTRLPLFGDFNYESVPQDAVAGPLPVGTYRLALLPSATGNGQLFTAKPVAELALQRNEEGWLVSGLSVWPEGHREFALRLRRQAADGDRLGLWIKDRFLPFGAPVPGPVHFRVSRWSADPTAFPQPEHHRLYDAQLVHEFFEEAPTDWQWLDGSFRMDSRWACQDQWNFMACGSPGAPFLTSKRAYLGRQEHDFFMTIRPVFPWDAGHADFVYNPREDPGFAFFVQNHGWYNRRDLNFCFDTDGRNPLSGYAVVFAGNDNTETLLLRRGQVVARTTDFFIPRDPNHGVVHWSWWRFTVSQDGGHVRINVNGQPLFEYQDPEPLTGGHVGFWTVRNGFILSRVSSAAEKIEYRSQVLYVKESAPSPWVPLLRDSVNLSAVTDGDRPRTRVTFNSGAGFQAVRWQPPSPVNLTQTPVLKLPLVLDAGVKVNLHLLISGHSYLVQLTAPVARHYFLLTPEFESQRERFQVLEIPEAQLTAAQVLGHAEPGPGLTVNLGALLSRLPGAPANPELTVLTIGNASNLDYLLAGSTGNQAGLSYTVGQPVFARSE